MTWIDDTTKGPVLFGRAVSMGAALWLIGVAAVRPGWALAMLLLSPLVLVPIALALADRDEAGPNSPAILTMRRSVVPLAAPLIVAVSIEPGFLSGLLTLPWFGFTIAVAVVGVSRGLSRRRFADPGLGIDIGMVFLAVGGAWLTVSRAGYTPFGFGDVIVELTAVHFHHVGFAVPVTAAIVARRLGWTATVPMLVAVGVVLTAIGITIGGTFEAVGATTMALAGVATAYGLMRLAVSDRGLARAILVIAGLALAAGMLLAMAYAWSPRIDGFDLPISTMVVTHGAANALGFGLLALIGLTLERRTSDPAIDGVLVHPGPPRPPRLNALADRQASFPISSPRGLLDAPMPTGFQRTRLERVVEDGDFDIVKSCIRSWEGHRRAGIRLSPEEPPLETGQVVALAVPFGPTSISACCRIVDVIDEEDRFGFVYATLPHHPEVGEERFLATRLPDGGVEMTIEAVWRPDVIMSRVFPWATRTFQRALTARYLDGLCLRQVVEPDLL